MSNAKFLFLTVCRLSDGDGPFLLALAWPIPTWRINTNTHYSVFIPLAIRLSHTIYSACGETFHAELPYPLKPIPLC